MSDKKLEIEDLPEDLIGKLYQGQTVEYQGEKYKLALDYEVKVTRNDGTVEIY